MKKVFLVAFGLSAVVFCAAITAVDSPAVAEEAKTSDSPDQAAIERTRDTVRMLDNVYKQTIVLITEKYVHTQDDFAAGSAAVLLFERISESGTHNVQLIDATGDPYDSENVADDAFEKQGVKRLKGGEDYVDQVVLKDGEPHLRAITPVPVVMERCIMCHAHYADVAKGEPIGAISYTIPIR